MRHERKNAYFTDGGTELFEVLKDERIDVWSNRLIRTGARELFDALGHYLGHLGVTNVNAFAYANEIEHSHQDKLVSALNCSPLHGVDRVWFLDSHGRLSYREEPAASPETDR